MNNRHIEPLIEVRNSELFCEKLVVTHFADQVIRLLYVSWHNDKTYVKEIELPE